MPRRPNRLAVERARELLDALQVRHPSEINVELIANHLNLLVRRRELQHEEGQLVRTDKFGIIVVSEAAYLTRKWRFVIAHELGHFLRDGAADSFAVCTEGNLADYTGSGRETDANDFASELLMPTGLFKRRCDRNRPCLKDISDLADEFSTSLTATALRFIQFAPEPCAIVHSTDGVVDWLDWTEDFRVGIRKGTKLTDRTYAGDIMAGKQVDDRPQHVDGDAWSDSAWATSIDLVEHSRKVGPTSVLTFLWHRYG